MNNPLVWFGEIGLSGFIDITIITLVIYTILVWMKHRKRAAAILAGILIVAAVYLLARQFNLHLTAAVLQGFFAIIIVVLVVIFQEELRYFFEQVAHWSLNRRLPLSRQKTKWASREHVSTLVRTARDLARERIGALVVLKGKDLLVRHLDGGEELGGRLSEPILKSIFDPHSIGHDGAVVIDRDVIESFGCHLPLSRNLELLQRGGTRHAAALGLSELSDALCLVVSEECGTISIARHGAIGEVPDPVALEDALEAFCSEVEAPRDTRFWQGFLKRNYREKFLALGMALALWFVLIHEAELVFRTFTVPVEFAQLPENVFITRVEPSEVEVALSGQRKDFYFFDSRDVRLQLHPWELNPGSRRITLSGSDVLLPEDLVLQHIDPREILVEVEDRSPSNPSVR
ncbi:MAG: hypothetical protein FJW35_09040 [Acidobacteria bacterium]|nr:hypothetical protein [Acidobacteriota bacterium]